MADISKKLLSRLHPDMGVPWLVNDEWLSLQIKDGPCSAACGYCYGVPELKAEAKKMGINSPNSSVKELLNAIPGSRLEMGLETVEELLQNMSTLGIKYVNLIGSEPTEHTDFEGILDAFHRFEISASVYSNGRHNDRLEHPAVGRIILHITQVANEKYMETVKRLIKQGVHIDLRVNFTSKFLPERKIVDAFLSKLSRKELSTILIKYSVTSNVPKQGLKGFDIKSFQRDMKQPLLNYLKEIHEKYPQVLLFSERVLFRCCFTDKELKEYAFANIVFKCSMEYTIYKDKKMKFCSPGLFAIEGFPIASANDILTSVEKIRSKIETYFSKPSFKECEDCPHRVSLDCYGGCIGYKLNGNGDHIEIESRNELTHETNRLIQINEH